MEEKKEDILKNLKRINSLGGALADLKSKVDTLKADISAINKKANAKERQIKVDRENEERIRLEKLHAEEKIADEVKNDEADHPVRAEDVVAEPVDNTVFSEKVDAYVDVEEQPTVEISEKATVAEEKQPESKDEKQTEEKPVEKSADKPVEKPVQEKPVDPAEAARLEKEKRRKL